MDPGDAFDRWAARDYDGIMPSSLAKKTKAELIEEYKQLLEKQKELQLVAREAYAPESETTLKKAGAHGDETIEKSMAQLRNIFSAALNKLADAFQTELQKLNDVRQAIEISKKRLAVHHHVEVAAGLVEKMLADYEAQKQALEDEISVRKRDSERAFEDIQYQATLSRKRSEMEFDEACRKREIDLGNREAQLKEKEKEYAELKKRVESLPEDMEKEISKRVAEMEKQLQSKHEQERNFIQKDTDLAKKMADSEMKSLRDQIARQNSEIVALRKEAEAAGKKAQELAVRVIGGYADRGSSAVAPSQKNLQQ